MTFVTRDESGNLTTSCVFLDGEVIEMFVRDGLLSDQGRAYEAVRDQTDHCTFPAHWAVQRAVEIAETVGIQYHNGCFTTHVTETTLEDASIRLINAMLLFYGVVIGACRIKETLITGA